MHIDEEMSSFHPDTLLTAVDLRRISGLLYEVTRLRKILYDTTSLRDWMQAGYSIDEYKAFNATYKAQQEGTGDE